MSSSNYNSNFLPEAPLFGNNLNQLEIIARQFSAEARFAAPTAREELIQRYTKAYGLTFYLYNNEGKQMAGPSTPLPEKVMAEVIKGPPPGVARLPEPIPTDGPVRLPRNAVFRAYTRDPSLYWAGIRLPIIEAPNLPAVRATLVLSSDSITGRGLFFDPWPWLQITAVVLAVSTLLWLPFVRSLTGALREMTAATEQIADEHFEVRVIEKRADELGRLGQAINHLAARLAGFVSGQKRFLGDISHELNSPLARMQFALSILEERVDLANRPYVEDVQEEVRLMSRLVSELLAFAKAGMKTTEIKLQPVELRPLLQQVIEREAPQQAVHLHCDGVPAVLAQPELLARAVANVLRNAVRYAGHAGPLTISAESTHGQVKLTLADQGPGVPPTALPQLFDPFYRLESDRARTTGGTGLGLAIVKTCIEACQGSVTAHNRLPNGLAIVISLKATEERALRVGHSETS